MKPLLVPLFACCLLLLTAGAGRAAETPPPELNASAGGVAIDPSEGEIEPGGLLGVSFPAAMVTTEAIDLARQPSPLVFDPPLDGTWYWKSQTDGQFTIGAAVQPGRTYRVTLVPGLKNLAGEPVSPAGWGATFTTKTFTAETDFEPTEHLGSRPQIVLRFTYPARLSDAADHIYFQDRDSAERKPAEIELHEEDNESDAPEGSTVRVTAREPLPLGRTFDLILDGVAEKAGGQPLAYLRRFPLGKTEPMKVKWLGAFNPAMEKPSITVRFDDYLDPSSVTPASLKIEPAVPDVKLRADGEDIVAEGAFDLAKHYQVTVGTDARGQRGYGLAEPSRWGATFRPKPSALYFPGARIFQRSRLGLRFAFLQVHTGALKWRLAVVPFDKLPAVEKRLREFEQAKKDLVTGKDVTDPDTGFDQPQPTELLVDAFGLSVRASGDFPATEKDAETLRELNWQPPAGAGSGASAAPLAGAYLLEISGPAADGRQKTVGNRSLVIFSDAVLTQKRTPDTVAVRVAGMGDGLPRADVRVRAVSESNFELASGKTDRDGLVRFPAAQLHPPKGERGGEPARLFIAETDAGPAVQFVETDSLNDVYIPDDPQDRSAPVLRAAVLTDRTLYRPGHTVKIKGFVRLADPAGAAGGGGRLRIPAGQTVNWSIGVAYQDNEAVAQGETTVSADGGWEAEWVIPEAAKLGSYRVSCTVGGAAGEGEASSAQIRVEEFKVPLFEVKGEIVDNAGASAAARINARYFSGQPLAGAKARWRVNWQRTDFFAGDFRLDDSYSEHAKTSTEDPPESKGEATLDAEGRAELRVPLPPNLPGARYEGRWEVAVTSADGQTVSATQALVSLVMQQPALLGLTAEAKAPAAENGPRTIEIKTAGFDARDQPAKVGDVRIELFRVSTKTVKERVAPFVTRYRNTPLFTSVKTLTQPAAGGEALAVPVEQPGRYVIVAESPGLRKVSQEALIDGEGADEVPVKNETSLEAQAEKNEYTPGQTAVFLTRAPVTGVAWVTLETDRILDSLLIPLKGNTSRIEIPVKKEYAPNARVSIYLLRPGGDDRLPAERYAAIELKVRRPDLNLEVKPRFEAPSVRPGQKARGFVQVSSEGAAVAGADVTVYAVDDAILTLGNWTPADLFAEFYPTRGHQVRTYAALQNYVEDIQRKSLYQKGFIIGGGGEEFGSKFVRKDFRPLAYWQTNLKTDAAGRVPFEFAAPDNLTRYRLVALVQTRASQFGIGSEVVEVAKPLIVEPALPRFLRVGDEVELRAVARQSTRDSASVTVHCTTDAGVKLLDADNANTNAAAPAPASLARNAPGVFRFRAKVADLAGAKITFTASSSNDPDLTDAVEVNLPIYPPTILRREAAAGTLPAGAGADSPDLTRLLPEDWKRAGGGHYDLAVSTTPDLSRLRGLPAILEYPHGCFEQISSRVLVYCAMEDLLAYLPTDPAQTARYRATVERALQLYDRSLLPDGSLPYWPGQKEANAFCTIQAAWAVHVATAVGYNVPPDLAEKLDKAVEKITNGRQNTGDAPFLRAFALNVQSNAGGDGDKALDADAARELYENRETLGDEGRALLAVALSQAGVMADEQRQLLREIAPRVAAEPKERAFDPATFGSATRGKVMAIFAMAAAKPAFWKPANRADARDALTKIMDRAAELSTQENLWSLIAFAALKGDEHPPKLRLARARPAPRLVAPNGTSAEWPNNALTGGANLKLNGLGTAALYYLLNAEYRAVSADEDARKDRGLRVERVVRNLTAPARTGQPGAPPVRVNDRLLITYRVQTAKLRSYVALEDALPAGLETVNPDLAMFAGFYDLPAPAPGERVLALSSSELHDEKTDLYFDHLEPGISTYSVLARATAAGTFRWPATQAGPMYEPLVGGLAPSSVLAVAGE